MEDSNAVLIEFESETGAQVSPLLFGTNIEHTRACVYKGLSVQMLRNRKFAGKPTVHTGQAVEWYPIGERPYIGFDEPYTRHHELYHMRRANEMISQRIMNASEGALCGIGQHELNIKRGTIYEFRIVAKADVPILLRAELTSRFGGRVYAATELTVDSADWKTFEARLKSDGDDADADLRLSFDRRASLCIGAVSLMPEGSFHGMRRDVIDQLKRLNVKLIRWPGGNFAGEYNWADGLLPSDMRAPLQSWLGIETQPFTMGFDYHEINTDDFIALCREVGAEPFITINPAWNTPEENAAWVEYCNGDTSTPYGQLRAQRGHPEKYNVRLWSLGNEFGYGHMEGENTPEGYAKLARANAEKMLAACPEITLCSSGPYPNEDWAKRSAAALSDLAPLASEHFYASHPLFRSAFDFEEEYNACVSSVLRLRNEIRQNRSWLPDSVGISMDEWNVWYAWNRRSNVADGIFTALTLHMLLSEAEELKIVQACHFEAVNEGLIEVDPYSARLTAQGEIFSLMSGHIGGHIRLRGLDAFATEREGQVYLTAVNPSYSGGKLLAIPLRQGEEIYSVLSARLYESDSVIPPSDFTVREVSMEAEAEQYRFSMPAHSVMAIWLKREMDKSKGITEG
ncbi:MAG: hypothetical protein IJM56_07245 [Clostridia bacterium]|nr:hypothetical protein [Clostridia bacterium]